MHAKRFATAFCLVALLAVVAMPPVAATTYQVTTTPYNVTNDVSLLDLWDAYEFNANTGQNIQFTVSPSGTGCLMVLFVKGTSVSPSSQYYSAYSQDQCGGSYSNTFPVGANDGQAFTIIVATTSVTAVNYSVSLSIASPGIPPILITLLALILIPIVVVVVVVILLVRRHRKKTAPVAPRAPAAGWPSPPPSPPQQPPQPPGAGP
jgi:hypothetical protein